MTAPETTEGPSRRRAMTIGAVVAALVAVGVIAVLALRDGDDDASTTGPSTSTSTVDSTSTSSSSSTSISTNTSTTASTAASLVPGAACSLGSSPDCIDPDQDGQGVYLIGGASCMAAFPESPGLCSDLDGDGRAGYPDSG